MANHSNEVIKKRYNRISKVYDSMDKMIKEEWRINLLNRATGKTLEAGVGTGANLAFYPNEIESLTGVDFSIEMLTLGRRKANKIKTPYPIKLIEADIQDLPFADNTFDTIVSTCVFCSVPDPIKGLMELKRVCKPEGKILMLEHMRSDNKLVGAVMDLLNPLTVNLWGANINRETIRNIELAGLLVNLDNRLMGSIMRKLVLYPNK